MDGRFDAVAVQALARLAKTLRTSTRVVGIRDLDWYYDDWREWSFETLPGPEPDRREGEGWVLFTLPCKELENLLCDADVLYAAYEEKVSKELLRTVLEEESGADELVNCWGEQLRPRIRERMDRKTDPSTKERRGHEIFESWSADPWNRCRFVAGKGLLGRIRARIREEKELSCYPSRMFSRLASLPPMWAEMAKVIFQEETCKDFL